MCHLKLLAFGFLFSLALQGDVTGDDGVVLHTHVFCTVAVRNDFANLRDTAGVARRVERNAAIPGAIQRRMLQRRFNQFV